MTYFVPQGAWPSGSCGARTWKLGSWELRGSLPLMLLSTCKEACPATEKKTGHPPHTEPERFERSRTDPVKKKQ